MELWYLVLGALLVIIALVASWLSRLPLTTTMLYLGVGIALGSLGFNVAAIDPIRNHQFVERLAELAVIVSLFTAGLKLPVYRRALWKIPLRLAFLSMTLTVGLVALVGVAGLGLPLGAAVLLGAVLAPTDPVLASDVQSESARDRDKLRFSVTGEAGLNDGTAFPFVMLGLGLLGLHELGSAGWRWFAVDVLWAISGGLAIGAALGAFVARVVLYLRHTHHEGLGRDEFLALGLIGLSYGSALAAHTYGFLAVFAAGLAFRWAEANHPKPKALRTENNSHKESTTAAHMTESVLNFNEQFERILEVGLVLVLGMMLTPDILRFADLWFVAAMLLVIRPLAVFIGLWGVTVPRHELALISWFGIRGIGSIYYLMYALGYAVPTDAARQLISITFWMIVVSVTAHGVSVTPLMKWYKTRAQRASGQGGLAGKH